MERENGGMGEIELMPKMMMISRHKHIDICTNMCIRFGFISVFIAAQAEAAALVAFVVVLVVVVAVALVRVVVASRQLVLIAPRHRQWGREMSRYKYDKSILWHRSHSLSFNRVLLVDAFNKRIGKTFTCHKWKFYYLNERTAELLLTPP